MLKIVLLVIFIFFLSLECFWFETKLFVSSPMLPKFVNQNEEFFNTATFTHHILRKSDDTEIDDFISSATVRANLLLLKNQRFSKDQYEIRILVGGGLLEPRWFILKHLNKTTIAYKVAVDLFKTKVVFNKSKIERSQRWWNQFEFQLHNMGFQPPISYPLSDETIPIIDGEAIYVEIKKKDYYQRFKFITNTKNEFGIKIVKICQFIETTFKFGFIRV